MRRLRTASTPLLPIDRRRLLAGGAALAASALLPNTSRAAAATRSVTTAVGTYDVPRSPRAVVAIDSRLDLEPAIALGLPVIGYSYGQAEPWVPVDPAVPLLTVPPERRGNPGARAGPHRLHQRAEQRVLADRRLSEVAPVLPVDFEAPWRTNLADLAAWLDLAGRADAVLAAYDALIADIRQRRAAAMAGAKVAALQYSPATTR